MSDLERLMAFLAKQPDLSGAPMSERRAAYDKAEKAFPMPDGVVVRPCTEGGVPGEWIDVKSAVDGRKILYLHGGGYGMGSTRSHRHLAAALGIAARADVLLPDYRLAPEHRFPAALDDALAVYRRVLAATSADRVAVMGDSAGGGLTIATLLAARDAGLALPAAAVCLSPWVDLTSGPDSPVGKATAGDPLVKIADLTGYARAYLGETPGTTPLASPVFADLRGLPALLIHASASEALASDATRLAEAARKAGVDVTLETTDGTPHVWHWFWPRLDMARESIKRVGEFVEAHMSGSAASPARAAGAR
ncbi:MAG: alpha/beta hydrolase [Alphaproteobacteria bacterium]|nr:alpha/beta hydrolase [Alphaproteobacteria bacterium]